ncbi:MULTISPECIES: rod shape-determining protein RodA [Chryseobacterium]|jgi:Bacterial cell division membrane protein|uniref:Rod shape-determining protein RodA n=1 Tax=Chryseobacterium rhizosphaerae TaxID=395937 RepID=A0AAE3YAB4_9FLAO|nr:MULTISPECIES: rod shape-determining protein RodA [Chryseobacterium]MBL3550083.1 rod shape-determining protein RodA [Chryseobacterium sp. KMC2]MDC8102245.1 rod shape-determining protein RodA [Chryseobacterium rhizosphaerae]MDR6526822.1 rod shape determining protein RodA [Chryseobacterium rhizosphaerae]MDR6544589.1 rod shape determining protein RodA [Chryseobacterium rhizosphaerae]REC78326.1 rod shape-determining protein RodA [Chryseobacterium rhizosphaerae]
MKWTEGIDKLGLGLYFLLCIFAIANIYSVDQKLGEKQLVFFCISVFVGLMIFFSRSKFFENMAGIIYIGGVLLLIGLFPFGKEILGQKNWYKFGSFTMQPVEFAKIGTALMLANYVSGPDFNLKNRKSLWTTLAIIGIPAAVVLAIPDVGSMLVFIAFFIALYREGLSGLLFGIGFMFAGVFLVSLAIPPVYVAATIVLIAGVLIAMNYHRMSWDVISISGISGSILLLCGLAFGSPYILEKLPKHQRERIEVLYKGEKAFRDTSGYNLLYSKTAIGSGGLLGKGYREGSVTQGKFVPEQETDYIFCTVGEEWGFVGSAVLILCYMVYIGRIYYLAEQQKSTFNRVFGYCFASILLMHFSINLGMVMGLFPTVGIPLPYFSYGGSSLLAFSMMTFIFFKLNYSDKNSLV